MMHVFFPMATEPDTSPSYAAILYNHKTMIYDLELDAAYNIVGGEWRSSDHPDFIWTLTNGVSPSSTITGSWDGSSALSADWASAARSASQNGRLWAPIVEVLSQRSRE